MAREEMKFDEERVRAALEKAWSLESAKQWSLENPANGQCNVTAVVVQELFGGEILRTPYPDVWHYYNRIEGRRCDLTDSQFTRPDARFDPPTQYEDVLSDREQAMIGVRQSEYEVLKADLLTELSGG